MARLSLGGTVIDVGLPDVGFHELTTWTHSWDAQDAVMYTPDSVEQAYYTFDTFTLDATPRVSYIPDRGTGNRPLAKDTGPWGLQYGFEEPLPGPKLITGNANRFNGRAHFFADCVWAAKGTINAHKCSMLSPVIDPRPGGIPPHDTIDGSATYFNPPDGYSAPYWLAILGHLEWLEITVTNDITGLPDIKNVGPAFHDTAHGGSGAGPTWGLAPGDKYGVACFGPDDDLSPNGFLWPTVEKAAPTVGGATQNVLGICYVTDGFNNSFLELNWREGGVLQKLHSPISLGTQTSATSYPYEECFTGFAETVQNSVVGIKLGTPTEAELRKIRAWANRYL